MRFEDFSFGSVRIDGAAYEHDAVIDRGEVRRRKKKASKKFRDAFGHTPLSLEEKIPWKCHRLVIGTGAYGRLPVMKEVLPKPSVARSNCSPFRRPKPPRGYQRHPARNMLTVGA
jgi:hypothetical protein